MKKRITTLSLKKELKYLKQNFDINQTKPFEYESIHLFKYIVFHISQERYAWPLSNLKEIVLKQIVVPIPGKCESLCGVFNYRNQVMPVINIYYLLGLGAIDMENENILMVTKGLPIAMAIPVDSLVSMISIAESDIKPRPISLSSEIASLIKGEVIVNNQFISILYPDAFIRG
jgi:chemotaxis signal transduction protein